MQVDKRGLSAFDNKRWLCDDNVHTLAFGHHIIPPNVVEMDEVEELPQLYDDEVIAPNVPLDREMPEPVEYVAPDAVDVVLEASRFSGAQQPPPPPELAGAEYTQLLMYVDDARRNGVAEDVLRPRIRACIDAQLNNDDAAWVLALLDLM